MQFWGSFVEVLLLKAIRKWVSGMAQMVLYKVGRSYYDSGMMSKHNRSGKPNMAIRLLNLRTAQGLTQEEVAEKAGLSPAGYIKIERGERHGKQETLEKIAAALKVSLPEILYGEEGDPEQEAAIRIPLPKSFTPAQIQQVRDFIGYLEWKSGEGAGYRSGGVREEIKEAAAKHEAAIDAEKESMTVIKPANNSYPK